jgi:hypothetical protein
MSARQAHLFHQLEEAVQYKVLSYPEAWGLQDRAFLNPEAVEEIDLDLELQLESPMSRFLLFQMRPANKRPL